MSSEQAPAAPERKLVLIHLLPFVLACCLFFVGLATFPLLEPDEGRNAEVAREMLVSGDWITPHYNSFPYLDKPVVFFWMVASAYKVAGLHEWSARLPSALMGLGLLLLSSFLARRMFGNVAALRTGVIVASAPLVMAFSRLVIFDMTLAFFLTLAMSCFWFAEAADFRRPGLDMLMFLAMGLATITKGPVGLLIPLLSITAYQALRGKFRELKRLRWGLGSLVFLAAVLPWFISISVRFPDFPSYALLKETLARFSGGLAHRRGGLLYYVPIYLAGFFPWSIFLLLAGWNRHKKWRGIRTDGNRPTLFLLTWTVVTFVFFSVSRSQLPGYFLPAVVPLSILTAKVWEEVGAQAPARSPDWLTAGFAFLLGVGLIAAASSQLALFSSAHSFLAKKIHPAVFAMLKPSILYTGLILAALALVGRNVSVRMRGVSLSVVTFLFLALTGPMLLVRWMAPLKVYAETNSSRLLGEALRSSPEKDLPVYGYYYFRTSLPFYLERPVGLVTSGGSELTSNYLVSRVDEIRQRSSAKATPPRTFKDIDPAPPGQRHLLDIREFIDLAKSSPQPRLIVVRNTHVNKLAQAVGPIEPLWTGWDYSVWEVRGGNPASAQDASSRVVNPFSP